MTENALSIIILAALGLVLLLITFKLAVSFLIQWQAKKAKITEHDPLLDRLHPGKMAIIYFTSPGCGPCKLMQKPVLQKLAKERGDSLQILEVDIQQQMSDALRWGVMKVPRTFIVDQNQKVRASNLDVAGLETLRQQLIEAEKPIQA